jgi:hypothetical protein
MQTEEHKTIPVNRLLEILDYDKDTGTIKVKKSSRVLVPDDTGSVTVYDSSIKMKRKLKMDTLAWMLFHKTELPGSYKLFHRNLNLEDNSARNLVAILKQEYSTVAEALNNLNHYMKFQLHPSDQYRYVLSYRSMGVERKETYDDLDRVREAYEAKRLLFVKTVNKYCITV